MEGNSPYQYAVLLRALVPLLSTCLVLVAEAGNAPLLAISARLKIFLTFIIPDLANNLTVNV